MTSAVFVVCSFPRSGTHFLMDVLRRNFRELHYTPPIWASAERLYFNLDREVLSGPAWSSESLSRPFTLVKTHRLFFEPTLDQRLQALAGDRPVTVLTPFRRLTRILESYRRYTCPDARLDNMLDQRDGFYGGTQTIGERLHDFYSAAAERSLLVDVEALRPSPSAVIDALGKRLGLTRRGVNNPLPPRRSNHGLTGEIAARIKGRPSSEVIVPALADAQSDDRDAAIEALAARLKPLQSALDSRAIPAASFEKAGASE